MSSALAQHALNLQELQHTEEKAQKKAVKRLQERVSRRATMLQMSDAAREELTRTVLLDEEAVAGSQVATHTRIDSPS